MSVRPRRIIFATIGGVLAGILVLFSMPSQPNPRDVAPLDSGATSRFDGLFPIGVFEDANIVNGDTERFQEMLDDLRDHGFDSVMFANGFSDRDAPLLEESDTMGFNVFINPAGDLNEDWWPAHVSANNKIARGVAQPVVERFAPHPSFRGYIVKDEPVLADSTKVAMITQAFHELDNTRPAMPVLIGAERVGAVFDASRPDVMLIDVYPIGYSNASCDFTMTGFGYRDLDLVAYIRVAARSKPVGTPLWMILQTHRFTSSGPFSLREPTAAEVRIQHWIAIGEGAKGIFWFVYSSQQGWTGLADNRTLYPEVARLAQRLERLRSLLSGVQKVPDRFAATGAGNPYLSTLASEDGQRLFVVAVNRDCEQRQAISVNSPLLKGRLVDVESAESYLLGDPIMFEPGDGKLFELVDPKSAATGGPTTRTSIP